VGFDLRSEEVLGGSPTYHLSLRLAHASLETSMHMGLNKWESMHMSPLGLVLPELWHSLPGRPALAHT
jgi:hypothetical protein